MKNNDSNKLYPELPKKSTKNKQKSESPSNYSVNVILGYSKSLEVMGSSKNKTLSVTLN